MKKKAQVQILIMNTDGGQICTVAKDGVYAPVAEHGDKVIVRYLIGGMNGYTLKDYEVCIHEVFDMEAYELDKSKLFVAENASVEASENFVSFAMTDDGAIRYANAIADNALSMRLGTITDEANGFTLARVYLTDSADRKTSVAFEVKFNGATATLIHGSDSATVEGINLTEFFSYKFSYTNSDRSIRDNVGTLLCNFKEMVNGDAFTGFPSGKVRIHYEIEGVYGTPKFLVTEISGYKMNSETDDSAPPQINFKDEIRGFAVLGEVVTLPAAIVADAASPVSTILLTVTVRGETVEDINGELLEDVDGSKSYRFKPTKTGTYLVTYYYYDAFDNSNDFNKAISVVEKNKPVININGNVVSAAKVGDKLSVPKYTVSDDTTAAEAIKTQVYIITHTGQFIAVDESYTFTEKGKYTLRYVAYDEFYNYTIKDFTVEVQ